MHSIPVGIREKIPWLTGTLDKDEEYVFISDLGLPEYVEIDKNVTKVNITLDEIDDYVFVESKKVFFKIRKHGTEDNVLDETSQSPQTVNLQEKQDIGLQESDSIRKEPSNKNMKMDNAMDKTSNNSNSLQTIDYKEIQDAQNDVIESNNGNQTQCSHSYCTTFVLLVSTVYYYHSVNKF